MDTYGYDLVFASTLDCVNKQLAAAFAGMDASFSYDGTDSTTSAVIAVKGKWGAWALTKGGSNKLLRFRLPIASGSMRISCAALGLDNVENDLAGVTVEVELQLGWLGGGSSSARGSGGNTNLVFSLVTRGAKAGDTTVGAVTAVSLDDPSGRLTLVARSVLVDVIADILIANRAKVNYVFAQLNPVPPSSESWLSPVRWDYFYQESQSGPAVLCVLSVLTDRELPPPAFDSSVLSPDSDAFLILSNETFLRHAVMPGLPAAYNGAQFTYQAIDQTHGQVVNNGHINTKTTSWGADTYYPYIDSFTLVVDGSVVRTTLSGRCDITGLSGAYITFSGSGAATCSYDPSTQAISFSAPTANIDSEKHIPWYDWVLGALSGGVGIAIIDGVIAAVTDSVRDGIAGAVQTTAASGLGIVTASTCTWGGKRLTPIAGGLAGCFWIRGNIAS
jgi:hypothetical protein